MSIRWGDHKSGTANSNYVWGDGGGWPANTRYYVQCYDTNGMVLFADTKTGRGSSNGFSPRYTNGNGSLSDFRNDICYNYLDTTIRVWVDGGPQAWASINR